MSRAALTVIVPAGNRVDVIEDCLASVRWADELLVVDSYSQDGTHEIAQRYADRILQHPYENSARQKNWAIPQAAHEWVLIVDTDERVSPALRQEIEATLADPQAAGYWLPRRNLFLGRWLAHTGYSPDHQLRLFRRDLGRYADRQVHAHLELAGPAATLTQPLLHYAHRTLDQTLANLLLQMTTWEARQRAPQPGRGRLWLLGNLLLRPPAAFILRFIIQGGWRDGLHGLAASLLWAMYVCITYLKIWESGLELPPAWWQADWESLSGAGDD